ncbi:hypothetical protein COOONC_11481, partial [Cooperia oncophora]
SKADLTNPTYIEAYTRDQPWYTVGGFLTNYYIPLLKMKVVKAAVIFITICGVMFGLYGMYTTTLGLELADVLPEDTAPAAFMSTLAPAQLNGTAPPPVCAYHISGASGQEIHNVRVGEQVKHEWICTSSVPKPDKGNSPNEGNSAVEKGNSSKTTEVSVNLDEPRLTSLGGPYGPYSCYSFCTSLHLFSELYAMLVHSCYIEDGAGQRYQVIDEHG